jgi:hypothetical protein
MCPASGSGFRPALLPPGMALGVLRRVRERTGAPGGPSPRPLHGCVDTLVVCQLVFWLPTPSGRGGYLSTNSFFTPPAPYYGASRSPCTFQFRLRYGSCFHHWWSPTWCAGAIFRQANTLQALETNYRTYQALQGGGAGGAAAGASGAAAAGIQSLGGAGGDDDAMDADGDADEDDAMGDDDDAMTVDGAPAARGKCAGGRRERGRVSPEFKELVMKASTTPYGTAHHGVRPTRGSVAGA